MFLTTFKLTTTNHRWSMFLKIQIYNSVYEKLRATETATARWRMRSSTSLLYTHVQLYLRDGCRLRNVRVPLAAEVVAGCFAVLCRRPWHLQKWLLVLFVAGGGAWRRWRRPSHCLTDTASYQQWHHPISSRLPSPALPQPWTNFNLLSTFWVRNLFYTH